MKIQTKLLIGILGGMLAIYLIAFLFQQNHNCCDFGRWLYACEDTAQKSSHWQCVRDCHATFHREAADVLQEAIEGDPTKATEAIISADSSFRAACDKLFKAMSAWAESNR